MLLQLLQMLMVLLLDHHHLQLLVDVLLSALQPVRV
jgi:hypothetical protein